MRPYQGYLPKQLKNLVEAAKSTTIDGVHLGSYRLGPLNSEPNGNTVACFIWQHSRSPEHYHVLKQAIETLAKLDLVEWGKMELKP